jgi:Copper binding proteins, plastocyanin/azurin family
MLPRYSYLILIAIVAIAAIVGGYVYVVPLLFSQKSTPMTVIHIPKGSSIQPANWVDFHNLTFPGFHYPFNFTVLIGTNNTIEWINDDGIAHTVTSLQVPSGAATFNSGLINPGRTFTTTLTVSGVYKYTCAWHNWLAGLITVKQS